MRQKRCFRFRLVLVYVVILFFIQNRFFLFATQHEHVFLALTEAYKCPICLDIVKSPKLTPRGHIFCGVCIELCLDNQSVCPLTKDKLSKDQLFKLRIVSQTANDLRKMGGYLDTDESDMEEFQDHIFYKPGLRPYTREDFRQGCINSLMSSIKYGVECAVMTVIYVSIIGATYLGFILYLCHFQSFASSSLP